MAEIRDTRPATGDNPVVAEIAALAARLLELTGDEHDGADLTDADRIDVIAQLEELKGTAAAAQARHTVDLDASVRTRHAELRQPAAQHGRGVAQQVGRFEIHFTDYATEYERAS